MKNDLTPKQAAILTAMHLINADRDKGSPFAEQLITNPAELKLVEQQLELLVENLRVKARLTASQEFHQL